MTQHHAHWNEALTRANSFRRKFELAEAIVHGPATQEVKSAARQVIRALGGVIDLPVADARVLAKARKRFERLSRLLAVDAEKGSLDKRVMRQNDERVF